MAYTLGIIGAGNMGAAIIRGCLEAKVVAPAQILVAELDDQKRRQFDQLGCATTERAADAAAAQHLLLAVKPQTFAAVAAQLAPLAESKLVITIMAGLSSAKVRQALGPGSRVVRAMPNTPCQIRAGITAIALGDGAAPGDERFALSIFNAIGSTVMLEESLMHAATAVSGSGPAYAFLLAEAMEQAAAQMGIPQSTARLLVAHTIAGAGRLLVESDRTADDLRKAVTSPGGTTSAAMEVMFEAELPETIVEALMAARDRGVELEEG